MLRKSLIALGTTALIMSGATATANAQSAAPYPSSEVAVAPSWIQTVQSIVPNAPADQIQAGTQIGIAWAVWRLGSAII
ncbi:hypothetical protein EAH68_07940 [Corynebacterium hylobatis]|uniref:Uncharacterized protein n=1 Tax=Corynebacterium hylobatis TaxID=1859290 RepID=A0A430HY45_9CORY|nr:hypothetical protein [Corynebacterium hylobatis]RSZ63114.1 hypothetical protein EAH68_07940 [Corynebacterium hylobatis]